MKLIQRIKQRFCRHTYTGVTKHTTPFVGWMFQCPKCNGYVAYFKNWDSFIDISEEQYELFREEGKKFHGIGFYKEDNDGYGAED